MSPTCLPYTCAKFAAVGLSEGLRAELGKDSHLFNGEIILLRNIDTDLLDPPLDLALQHIASVLGWPDQVVEGSVDGMGCASERQGEGSAQCGDPHPCSPRREGRKHGHMT